MIKIKIWNYENARNEGEINNGCFIINAIQDIIIIIVGSQFVAQAQNVWSFGSMSPIQWICREWVKKLGPNELDNG